MKHEEREKRVRENAQEQDRQAAIERAGGSPSTDRRRFLKTGGTLAVGGAAAYSMPAIARAAASGQVSPQLEFVNVWANIAQGYDEFVAVTIPLMATLELTPPDSTAIPEMSLFAENARDAAQDAVSQYNMLAPADKSSVDQARDALGVCRT